MPCDYWLSSVEKSAHLLLRQPYGLPVGLYLKTHIVSTIVNNNLLIHDCSFNQIAQLTSPYRNLPFGLPEAVEVAVGNGMDGAGRGEGDSCL